MNQPPLILVTALLLLLIYRTDAELDIITSTQDIRVGEEILLLCKAGGEGEMTWKKNDADIDDEEKVTKVDETSSKLVIKKASMEDAGKYTCLCEYESRHKDQTETKLYVYEGPSFGHTRTYHEFLEGTQVVVPCLVTGQPAVEATWLRDSQTIPSREGSRVRQLENTLLIDEAKREDAGMYVCQAQIRGRPVYHQLPVSVVINVPPTVHLKEDVKKVLAGPETNVSLLCLVDGIPKPNINWTMPTMIDPSRHEFNSDRSQLMIRSVVRNDYGEYVCTATNKIAESSATIILHVFEAPEVFLSSEQETAVVGQHVSVSCNVSGHPQPVLHWLNKQTGRKLDAVSGRLHVVEGVLVIEEVGPSDGGLYSCMAVSTSGNASRDVAILTPPDPPHYLSVSPGPASVVFSLKTLPISGGTPITSFALQWKQQAAEQWKELTVPVSGPLIITTLKQYTSYSVRMAALNAVGVGQFSESTTVHTLGIHGEPDSPVLPLNKMKVERNTFSIPLQQVDQGATPLQHFNLRYRKDEEGSEWKEMQLSPSADSVSLRDLSFRSGYEVRVTAINANGSSIPATFNFTIGEQPAGSGMTKGSVVGIVIVIFLLVFLAVDATCCYRNHCGLLMSIAVKLFGHKVPGIKMLEEGTTNGEEKLKGISTPRSSMQMAGVQTKEAGKLSEVTSDKASLTKHEKTQPCRDQPSA